jgi:hypothetical protein
MEPERAVSIPFSSSAYVSRSLANSKADDASVLLKYKPPPDYVFCLAQFRPHKIALLC